MPDSQSQGREQWIHGFFRGLPWLIVVAGIAITQWLAWLTEEGEIQSARAEFEIRVGELVAGLDRRLTRQRGNPARRGGTVCQQCPAWSVTSSGTYVEGLGLATSYPNIQGVGYAPLVSNQEIKSFRGMVRSTGLPDYEIKPPGERNFYVPVMYIEPDNWRNQRAPGFDLYSVAVRREALDTSRDTGQVIMSGIIKLIQETDEDVQAGVAVFSPVYRHLMPLENIEQRRAALAGWAFTSIRIRNLVESYLLGEYPQFKNKLSIRIRAGASEQEGALIYDSAPSSDMPGETYEVLRHIDFGGRTWFIRMEPLPGYLEGMSVGGHSRTIWVMGSLLTALLSVATFYMHRTHRRMADALLITMQANRQLIEKDALLHTIYDTSSVSMCVVGTDGRIQHANKYMFDMFGREAEALIGESFLSLVPQEMREDAQGRLRQLISGSEEMITQERNYLRENRSEFWGLTTSRCFRDADGVIVGVVIVIADITDRHEAENHVRHLAFHDYLTGLPNRFYMMEHAMQSLAIAKRYQRRVAVLFLDLDRSSPSTMNMDMTQAMLCCVLWPTACVPLSGNPMCYVVWVATSFWC